VLTLALLALAVNLALPALARADGVIVVEPPPCDTPSGCPSPVMVGDQLVVKYHRVDVTIKDQVATTKIDQVFHNPNDWVAEGTYLFPVPADASVGEFIMYVDGQPVEATIRDAAEARAIYDDIVRRMRDPALLEYVGRGLIQASVFPIQPGEDRQIQIEYQQVLTAEGGLLLFVLPLF
jgi:Ca-activated chloride channel family protein